MASLEKSNLVFPHTKQLLRKSIAGWAESTSHILVIPQLGEGIDDNTEDDVQGNDVDEQEESYVVYISESIFLSRVYVSHRLSNSSSISETQVYGEEETVQEGVARLISIFTDLVDKNIPQKDGVGKDQEDGQHEGQEELIQVEEERSDDEFCGLRYVDDQQKIEGQNQGGFLSSDYWKNDVKQEIHGVGLLEEGWEYSDINHGQPFSLGSLVLEEVGLVLCGNRGWVFK